MKMLIASLALMLTTSCFADYSSFQDVEADKCPGLVEVKRDVALCTKVKGASEILTASARYASKLESLPNVVEFYNVIELGIWPDDSTSMMYWFPSILRSASGKDIGYRVFHAYHNTEMESTIKLETRYNLDGKLVSIEIFY